MLHNRQAPGRDFHKHFSLAPARSDTNPPSNPQSAPAPSPLQDRAQARNATSRAPHLSLISLTPPAPSRLRPPHPRPTPSPLPSLHFHQVPFRTTHKGARGAQAGVVVGRKGHPPPQPQRHPPLPLRPRTALCIVGLPDARTRVCARSAAMHGQGAPTLKFASVSCYMLTMPPLSLGSRCGHSGSDSVSTIR